MVGQSSCYVYAFLLRYSVRIMGDGFAHVRRYCVMVDKTCFANLLNIPGCLDFIVERVQ